MTLVLAALVALAGALGALCRTGLTAFIGARASGRWGTWGVNISGSFALGALASLIGALDLSREIEVAVGGGFLGAYTTFSTWAVQISEDFEAGRRREALANAVGSLATGPLAAMVGFFLGAQLA